MINKNRLSPWSAVDLFFTIWRIKLYPHEQFITEITYLLENDLLTKINTWNPELFSAKCKNRSILYPFPTF